MSLYKPSPETEWRGLSRGTSLNPNATEFVPFSLRASPASNSIPHKIPASASSGKQIIHPSHSSISPISDDEEARQYWQQQLPDDITPDFNVVADADIVGYVQRTSKPWEMQLLNSDQHLGNESASHAYTNDLATLQFLASLFPDFSVESLADVYFANGCHLNLTIEMLTQLELQVDGASNQNMNVKNLSAPVLTSMNFPTLPVPDSKTLRKYTGAELKQTVHRYCSFDKDNLLLFNSSSFGARKATDFASTVHKLATQDSGLWKYDRKGSADSAIGSSRSSHALTGLYSVGTGRSVYPDRMQSRGSAQAAPVWLETGDAVANLYTDVLEEARDRARIRNTYFEQARQAYLVGNKALAKELSVKGHLHNMQMKAAHSKARESIYRERNPITPSLQGAGRCQEKMIDLHGLHVSEAIHVLKQELSVLKNAARLAEQWLHVYICVGTGHHTRGSHTPARLPVAVQRYLLEEEGLEYSEPQPGLLHVVLY